MRRLFLAFACLIILPSWVSAQPTCISQAQGSPTQAIVGWSYPAGAPPVTGFSVLKATTANGPWQTTATVGATTSSYTDTAVVAGTTYYYEITATNAAGTSPPSNIVCKAMLLIPPVSPSATIAKVGLGRGTVTSSPGGIDCGRTCTAAFARGTSLVLSAAPQGNGKFCGWSGAGCYGTAQCVLVLNESTTITAWFGLRRSGC